jgi:tripartite ATP-independent transporter DctM subunit
MDLVTIALLITVLLFVFFVMGLGIGISMALAGFIGFAIVVNLHAALKLVAHDTYNILTSYGFTVIPLFILMGQIGVSAGMAKGLYDACYRFIGHVPGGLAIGTVMAGVAFKTICGSAAATAATFATVAVPEMDRYGYDKRLSCGTVAVVGTLGAIIPPSVTLIVYALLTAQSIGKLFFAGIVPGIMIAFSFVATLLIWGKINPGIFSKGEKSTWKARFSSLAPVAWVIAIFLVVVGGLLIGIFTPTEAGSVGSFAVLLLAIVQREITFKGFAKSIVDSLQISCMVLMLLVGATILGHFYAVTKTPFIVGQWLGTLPVPPSILVIIIILVYLLGGSFIEDLAFLILITPIILPTVFKLGFDPVWFGIISTLTIMIGAIIPPMALGAFVVAGITKVPLGTIYKGIYPFLVGMSIVLLICVFFPQIVMWLPNLLMK